MNKPSILFAGLLVLTTSCGSSVAWSQSQPRPVAVAVAAAAPLAEKLAPKSELHRWIPSSSPPSLTCPAGAVQERRTTEKGWETWCARKGIKHGESRELDRAERRETRQSYEDGKLHGPASEIRLRPGIRLAFPTGSGVAMAQIIGVEEVVKAAQDLATWLPVAAPPRLTCPAGTTQHDEKRADGWTAECRQSDGVVHGPRWKQDASNSQERSLFDNGREIGATIVIEDGRTVTETTYDKGVEVRKLTWSGSFLATLDAARGQSRVRLRFHPGGTPAQLSRFKGDARDGEWQSWHPNGVRAELVEYAGGKERSGARKWDDQGRLIETRKLEDGTGIVERIQPGRNDEKTVCEHKAGRLHGACRTTNKAGVLVDEMFHVDGEPRSRKTWYENGQLWTEWTSDPATHRSKQTNYVGGRVEQVMECDLSACRTTRYDDKGKPVTATPASAQGPQPVTIEDVLRGIQDML